MNQLFPMKVSPYFIKLKNESTADKFIHVDDDRNSNNMENSNRRESSSLIDTAVGGVARKHSRLARQDSISAKFRRKLEGKG
jgi:hypothetical protein